ncbi:hypothetical protein RB4983 [Rhodopirellula baltica SH 1]|uniref:Uncharacterized protein n=1 Tax=Rhodopirellula baltica (strain DSM 10527 / NCIMB 13988 / SH1) TaxID=243090 RepID=Q7UGW2_RHOBA|nr:hypothetical protein RB4983 [Rhodopirellula baltica SH 1]
MSHFARLGPTRVCTSESRKGLPITCRRTADHSGIRFVRVD